MKPYNHLEIEKKWSEKVMQKYLQQIEQQIIPKELEFEFQNLDELSNYPQDDQILIREYGYDIINLYHLFSKPSSFCDWEDGGLDGVDRFVRRFYKIMIESILNPGQDHEEYSKMVNRLNNRVHNSICHKKKSTIVSAFMTFYQELSSSAAGTNLDLESIEEVLKLLLPFAPYIAIELWEELKTGRNILEEDYPVRKEVEQMPQIFIPVQVNGRTRNKILVDIDASEEEIIALAKNKIKSNIDLDQCGMVYIPLKIINFVS